MNIKYLNVIASADGEKSICCNPDFSIIYDMFHKSFVKQEPAWVRYRLKKAGFSLNKRERLRDKTCLAEEKKIADHIFESMGW